MRVNAGAPSRSVSYARFSCSVGSGFMLYGGRMTIDLTAYRTQRQRACADTVEGHLFDGPTCSRCGLTVNPSEVM